MSLAHPAPARPPASGRPASLEALAPGPTAAVAPSTVVILQWPAEAHICDQLRDRGIPRLLVVDAGGTYPLTDDPSEDWMFATGHDDELRRRITALERRAVRLAAPPAPPRIDEHDLLRYDGGWIALPPGEAGLMRLLLERVGTCTPIEELAPEAATRSSLRGRIKRLRQRVAPLGFTITTVRSRGFILTLAP